MSEHLPVMMEFVVPEDPALLAAIGRVAAAHAMLDDFLKMTVKIIAGVTPIEARKAMAREGSRQLRERISKLAKRRIGDGPALLQLQALMTEASELTERRNDLIHGLWTTDSEGAPIALDKQLKQQQLPPVADYEKLAGDYTFAVTPPSVMVL